MSRTRVKICGIRSVEDALAAVAAGADAIGLVFFAASPRAVSIPLAKTICDQLPAFVSVVALTVDADESLLETILRELPVSYLQFHGDESAAHCEQWNKPYIKALRMKSGIDLAAVAVEYASASSLLVDTYKAGVPGGTGTTFDWSLIPPDFASRIILAGGLNGKNVREAIATVRPYAVDVSGGVESRPGDKDHNKIQAFLKRVTEADQLEL